MKNEIFTVCLQGRYRDSLGQFSNTSCGVFGAERVDIYLLLAKCEVCTASYGLSFPLPFMAQAWRAQAMKTRKEKNKDLYLAVRTEQSKLIRCLLYGFVDYSGFEKVIES